MRSSAFRSQIRLGSTKIIRPASSGSDRAKHIDLREHFVHEAQSNKVLQLEPVDSADNAADLLTKLLLKAAFLPLRKRMMGF